MLVMAQDPIPDMNVSEVKLYFTNKTTEKDLADAYAIVHNKFWWVEDNEYDYEEGTPEHEAACAVTDEWGALMGDYKKRIFEILTSQGVSIPVTGQSKVLEPFMARHGYVDGNGWWIKDGE